MSAAVRAMRNRRPSLIHLIYFSRSALTGDAAERTHQINEIARHAQKKNEFSVITSSLIVEQNFFAQLLEGERTSVQEAFNRIQADGRHRDVQIVEWREVPKREFVSSFTTTRRTPSNEGLFQKSGLLPMLQRGTPKGAAIYSLAFALQAETMAKQGIEHLFV